MILLNRILYEIHTALGRQAAKGMTILNICIRNGYKRADEVEKDLKKYQNRLITHIGAAMQLRHLRLVSEYPSLYSTYLKLISDPEIPIYLIKSFNPKAARNAILKRELERLRLDIDFLDSLIPKENFSNSETPLGLISVQFKEVIIFESSIALYIRFVIEVYPDYFELLLDYGGFTCFNEETR